MKRIFDVETVDAILQTDKVVLRCGNFSGAFCYKEPEPRDMPDRFYGYDLEPLIMFAEACRISDVKNEDLKAFANNAEFAYNVVANEMNKAYRNTIDDIVKIQKIVELPFTPVGSMPSIKEVFGKNGKSEETV